MFGRQWANILVLSVIFLVGIVMVMLFSVSSYAQDTHGDIYFFVRKQAVWLGLGLCGLVCASLLDYHLWRRLAWPLLVFAIILLACCFVPGIGSKINGSWRWIHIGPISFQPSEIAKLASVIML